MDNQIVLKPDDKRWKDFANTLAQKLGRSCDGTLKNAHSVLSGMEGVDVDGTLVFFEGNGGFCDCEVLMNVAASYAEEHTVQVA